MRIKARLKKSEKPQIIAIGDSWFNLTMFDTSRFLKTIDTIDWLKLKYDIINCAIPGYKLMDESENKLFKGALKTIDKSKPLIVLLSLGGNDMIDVFSSFVRGNEKMAKMKKSVLKRFVRYIFLKTLYHYITMFLTEYNGVLTDASVDCKNIRFIMHGYDYFHPEKTPSSTFTAMLKNFFTEKKVPINIANKLVRDFVDINNEELKRLTKKIPCLAVIDLRGKIPKNYWDEQIHPTADGYSIVAFSFEEKIKETINDFNSKTRNKC